MVRVMALKLYSTQITLSDILAVAVDKDKYVEHMRRQAAHELAEYLLETCALYECYPNDEAFCEIHRWTILVEDDAGKIIEEIIRLAREEKAKKNAREV